MRSILVVLVCAFLLTGALGQSPSNLEAQRSTVVKLRTNGSGEIGAGVLVGKDNQYGYIITARHVVAPTIQASSAVKVQFYKSFQESDGTVLGVSDQSLDLAVVRVPAKDVPKSVAPLLLEDVRPDTQVHIIGHPAAGEWSVWPGYIQNENGPSDVRQFITNRDQSLAGGYSGGPVLTSHGDWFGMHISTSAGYGVAVKSGDITRQLNVWNIPTNNIAQHGAVLASSETELLNKSIKLSASPDFSRFEYGFSSVRHDDTISGTGLKLAKVRVRLKVRSYSRLVCCDAWLLLAPSSDMFAEAGQISSVQNPALIQPHAPVQVRFVVGNGGTEVDPGVRQFEAVYDAEANTPSGQVDRMAGTVGRWLDLPNGIYMQMFFWDGNPSVTVEIQSAKVQVEFTR